MKVDKMKGMKVITADAFALGEVGGAVADPKTWQITHLDLELSKEAIKEFAFKKPMLGSLYVCLPVTAVKRVENTEQTISSPFHSERQELNQTCA